MRTKGRPSLGKLLIAGFWGALVLSNGPLVTLAQPATWLSGPPVSASAVPLCPEPGQWLLLYWAGPAVSIDQAAHPCPTADRFWSSGQDGRWVGFSPALPQASDLWTMLPGVVAFVHGKDSTVQPTRPRIVHGFVTFYEPTNSSTPAHMSCGGELSHPGLAIAAAHPGHYPCGTRLRVTEPRSGRSVEVTITDYCPGCARDQLDLSRGAFAHLGDPALGRLDVVWEVIAGA